MADEKREVNFSEVVEIEPTTDTENVEEVEDIEPSEDETDTQEESSPQENQEVVEPEETIQEETTPDTSKEPKPVEGETPRETALRLETQRLRRDLRNTRNQKVFEGYKPEVKDDLSEEEKATLGQYDQTELSQFEKIIDVVAKKKGWVNKGDFQATSYQQQASDSLDGWLESHKEYLPENDKDNLLWNEFQREFSLYRKPDNPKDLKRIFDKVHKEVFGISEGVNDNKLNAQKEKVKIASHSGSSQKSQIFRQSTGDPNLKQYLKGFSEEEKDEIIG